jgi:hypothetical protein
VSRLPAPAFSFPAEERKHRQTMPPGFRPFESVARSPGSRPLHSDLWSAAQTVDEAIRSRQDRAIGYADGWGRLRLHVGCGEVDNAKPGSAQAAVLGGGRAAGLSCASAGWTGVSVEVRGGTKRAAHGGAAWVLCASCWSGPGSGGMTGPGRVIWVTHGAGCWDVSAGLGAGCGPVRAGGPGPVQEHRRGAATAPWCEWIDYEPPQDPATAEPWASGSGDRSPAAAGVVHAGHLPAVRVVVTPA